MHRPDPGAHSGWGADDPLEKTQLHRRVEGGGASGRNRGDPPQSTEFCVCRVNEPSQLPQRVPMTQRGKRMFGGGSPTCSPAPSPAFCLGHEAWNQERRVQKAPNNLLSFTKMCHPRLRFHGNPR